MTPRDYIAAARVPHALRPQTFGLWTIQRLPARVAVTSESAKNVEISMGPRLVGFPDYTLLRRHTLACEMGKPTEVVMEDSRRELRKHLPIWLAARGRVLVTGLGLGCVVRGLLAKPEVEHVDVVEIDGGILRVVGAEFRDSNRVTLIHGDALETTLSPGSRWDFAWHDLWVEGDGLQLLHAELFHRFRDRCGPQGAWAFPRHFARLYAERKNVNLLGAPRYA